MTGASLGRNSGGRARSALAAGMLVLVMTACGAEAQIPAPVALDLAVHARAIEPGEPLRVVVTSPVALRTIHGRFGDREVYLVPNDDRTVHVGFTLVGVDDGAGPVLVRVSGTTDDGAEARAERALTIVAKRFPEERLSVEPKFVEPPAAVSARIERERALVAEVYRQRTPLALDRPLARPVPGAVSSPFGKRRVYNGQPRSPHNGVDFRATTGVLVAAAAPGRVALAMDLYFSGKTVILDHGAGLFTIYAHLSRLDVGSGDAVDTGHRLGLSGATGRVTGPHLHFGAKIGDEPFDPLALMDPSLFS